MAERDAGPAIEAVIFDWGGTLTPWKTVDYAEEWRSLAKVAAPDRVEEAAGALLAASERIWARARDEHRSGTLEEVCRLAGVEVEDAHFEEYRLFWDHATYTDEDVAPLFDRLAALGVRVGVLSNTIWPREWHEAFFRRDGVLDLIHGAVYTSEIPWTKPAPEAFAAAMAAVGATEPGRCVYVGDRLFEDIWGGYAAGMRTIHVPHSDIPREQVGHTEGDPDAVVQRLADVYDVVSSWLWA